MTVHVGDDGALRDVSIATDRDTTWDAEGDDDRNDVSLADRLSENAYGAVLWILEADPMPVGCSCGAVAHRGPCAH